MLKDLKASGG